LFDAILMPAKHLAVATGNKNVPNAALTNRKYKSKLLSGYFVRSETNICNAIMQKYLQLCIAFAHPAIIMLTLNLHAAFQPATAQNCIVLPRLIIIRRRHKANLSSSGVSTPFEFRHQI